MISYVLLFLANQYLQVHILSMISYLLLFLIIVLTLPVLGGANRIVSLGMVIVGSLILALTGHSLPVWLEAFSRNAALAALFITIPMLSIPLSYRDYHGELKNFAQRHVRSPLMFYILTLLLSHLFGLIILVGAIPLVHQLFHENAKLYKAEDEFISALIHGQVFGGFWSPVWSSMIILTAATGIGWITFVPLGLTLTILALGSSILRASMTLRTHGAVTLEKDETIKTDASVILKVTLLTVVPILLILTLNQFAGLSIIVVIALVSFVFPLLVALVQNRWRAYAEGMRSYLSTRILGVKNEVVLLTAAGFFGMALELANVDSAIRYLIPGSAARFPLIAILSLMLVYVLMSYIGLHPVVAGSAMVASIDPATLGLSPFIFTFTLICGWATGVLLSPFSATNLITGGLSGKQGWSISMRMHGAYGFGILFAIALFLAMLSRWM